MVEQAQRRIVALEDVRRFEGRFDKITVDFRTRTITVTLTDAKASPWVHRYPIPDPAKATHNEREDRPHDLAAIVKAACRLVGFM
jgi:hypothetical protein